MNTPILEGRIALVTGGSKGIGFGSAQRLIEEGAFVYITGRGKEALDAAVFRLGSSAVGIEADAASKADMTAVAEQIRRRHGKLDILFANPASAMRPRSPTSPRRRSTRRSEQGDARVARSRARQTAIAHQH